MSWSDDFKLGLAGVADLAAHAVGIDSTLAADEYAKQAAQGGESYSKTIAAAQAKPPPDWVYVGGSTRSAAWRSPSGELFYGPRESTPWVRAQAQAAAEQATAEGAIEDAAAKTAKQVKAYATRGLWIAAAIAVPVLAVGAWIYTAPARAVARAAR